ncbi:MAG: hypothetical protein Q9184_006825, partial [Pyrenodesmia sp. 2 TL-2023]
MKLKLIYLPLGTPSEEPVAAPQPQTVPQQQSLQPPQQSQYPSTSNPRKRKASEAASMTGLPSASFTGYAPGAYASQPQQAEQPAEAPPQGSAPKKSRTNTPWSPAEEQRLKTMRDAGNTWNEIAK